MGRWYQRRRFDLGDVENAKNRFPTAKFQERVVIATQCGRKLGCAGENAIQHAAYSQTIKDTGVDCKTYDAPRVLVHDHHDPVATQEQQFATKEIESPETILGVSEER